MHMRQGTMGHSGAHGVLFLFTCEMNIFPGKFSLPFPSSLLPMPSSMEHVVQCLLRDLPLVVACCCCCSCHCCVVVVKLQSLLLVARCDYFQLPLWLCCCCCCLLFLSLAYFAAQFVAIIGDLLLHMFPSPSLSHTCQFVQFALHSIPSHIYTHSHTHSRTVA